MTIRRLVIMAVITLWPASLTTQTSQAPSTSQPTFRAGVRVVEIDTVVRDRGDNFVAGLTKDDFEVIEDGVPQEIVSVTMLNLPEERRGRPALSATTATPAVEVEVHGPTLSSTSSLDDIGRVYVMVLNVGDRVRIKAIAREFIEDSFGPSDLMAVIHGDRAATPGLTNDKEVLLAAVDRFAGGRGDGLAILKEVTVNLNAMRGRRKAILFFQNDVVLGQKLIPAGIDSAANRQARRDWDEIARIAIRNNVRIYPIDPRGFTAANFADMTGGNSIGLDTVDTSEGVGDEVSSRQGTGAESLTIAENAGAIWSPNQWIAGGFNPGVRASRIMAADTGAIAIVNTSNYGGNFRRIVRDNSAYYVIGFYSSAEDDGKMHRIQVRVKTRPELSVRSRSGYQAPAADVKGSAVKLAKNLSASARSALSTSASSSAGLPIEIFTAVFRDGFDGSVLIGSHVPGAGLNLAPKERVELSYVAVDRWGTIRAADRRAFTLTFSDTTRKKVEETGVRLFGRLRLPRGHYEIRVAVHQPGGATGSAIVQVEIPDYTTLTMSVSDLVVASSHGRTLLTLEDDAVLRRALATQPTPRRRFTSSETLSVFGEIYNGQWVLTQQIGVSTIIRSADGRVVARGEDRLSATDRGRGYFNGRIPLKDLAPGEYAMTLEVYTRNGIPASASHELRFEIADEP